MITVRYTPAEFSLSGLSTQHLQLLENMLLTEQGDGTSAPASVAHRKLIPELLTSIGAALSNLPGS